MVGADVWFIDKLLRESQVVWHGREFVSKMLAIRRAIPYLG
jgi:hypothetical protein